MGFGDGRCEDGVQPAQEHLQLGEAAAAGPWRALVARTGATGRDVVR